MDWRRKLIERALRERRGERPKPIGYVFMIGSTPRGVVRRTHDEALRDAVLAGEAFVDTQYNATMTAPLTWVAPVWP